MDWTPWGSLWFISIKLLGRGRSDSWVPWLRNVAWMCTDIQQQLLQREKVCLRSILFMASWNYLAWHYRVVIVLRDAVDYHWSDPQMFSSWRGCVTIPLVYESLVLLFHYCTDGVTVGRLSILFERFHFRQKMEIRKWNVLWFFRSPNGFVSFSLYWDGNFSSTVTFVEYNWDNTLLPRLSAAVCCFGLRVLGCIELWVWWSTYPKLFPSPCTVCPPCAHACAWLETGAVNEGLRIWNHSYINTTSPDFSQQVWEFLRNTLQIFWALSFC